MAELEEPTFSTAWFSLKWLKSKCHPNMLPYRYDAVVNILETGLLFREDALQIEDALQMDNAFMGRKKKNRLYFLKFTPGEKVLSAVALGVCIATIPLKFPINTRNNLYRAICWAGTSISVPILQRLLVPNTLPTLLQSLSEYTILVRKCLSCIKEQSLHMKPNSSMSIYGLNSTLVQQHRELCSLLNKTLSIVQNVCPWLTSSWEINFEINSTIASDDLVKLHHLFLILQSTLLKNISMIQLSPPMYAARFNTNYNERIYWIHTELVPYLLEPVQDFVMYLNNSYRIFKECAHIKDSSLKSLPKTNREPWQYSEVHASVLLLSSEMRSALSKINDMDTFLEACWNAKSKFSPSILEEDLSAVKDELNKCYATVENTAIQLKKIKMAEMKLLELAVQKLHLPAVEEEEIDIEKNVKTINEDTEIDIKDQVFYYEQTDDEKNDTSAQDYLTGPGKAEIQATKIVLGELKRKLVKREDEMRQREAIALEETMPEYKGKIPEFPRQILVQNNEMNNDNISELSGKNCTIENQIESEEEKLHEKNKTKMNKDDNNVEDNINTTVASTSKNTKNETENNNIKSIKSNPVLLNSNLQDSQNLNNEEKSEDGQESCNKKMPSTSNGQNQDLEEKYYDSDFSESDDSEKNNLLQDIRKNRVTRKKNYPSSKYNNNFNKKAENAQNYRQNGQYDDLNPNKSDSIDDDLKPVEYTFGTGMAMASLLHISRPSLENQNSLNNAEEVFIGDGEVSDDSGNET